MSNTTDSELNFTSICIWPGYGTLPTFDPECLCALAHLAFLRLNVRTDSNLSRLKFFKERLPLLLADDKKVCLASGYDEIANFCSKSHINIDERCLSPAADLLALEVYVKSNFIPSVLETLWLDETFRSSTIHIYGRSLGGFPLAFLFGKNKKDKLIEKMKIFFGDFENEQNRKFIFEKGKRSIDALSQILGNKPFLFGVSPTSVDALAFGYLAALINGAASNSGLGRYASSQKNLRDFVNRILTIYLGDLTREISSNERNFGVGGPSPNEDRLRDKVAVIAIGVLTMCAYAFFTGLVRIEISEVE